MFVQEEDRNCLSAAIFNGLDIFRRGSVTDSVKKYFGNKMWKHRVERRPLTGAERLTPLEDYVVYTTKRTQTPPGRVSEIVGAKCALPTKRGWVSSQVVIPNQGQASQMADPVKAGPILQKDYRYRARCVPAVAVRTSGDSEVPVVSASGGS